MPMMTCRDCLKRHSTLAVVCPNCGRPNADAGAQPRSPVSAGRGAVSATPNTSSARRASAEAAAREDNARRMRFGLGLVLTGVVGAVLIVTGPCSRMAQEREEAERPAADTAAPAMDLPPTPPPASDPRDAAAAGLSLAYRPTLGGYRHVLLVDLTIKNASAYAVRDVEVTCISRGESGTEVSRNPRTFTISVPAEGRRRLDRQNMGLVSDQADRTSCEITDFSM